jgi:energy-coupling factor transport system permease protein
MKFLSDITLGNYYPAASSVHALDPRVKLIGLVVTAVTLLSMQNLWGLTLFSLASLLVIQAARLPLSLVVRGLRPFIGLLLLTACLQIFLTDGQKLVPLALGPLSLTREGFYQAVRTCGQISLIILFSSILTLTTSPLELLRALEKLSMPLRRCRVPVSELCLAMLLCIRFLPILGQESQRIVEAQRARGIDLNSGTWRQRLQKIHGIFLALLYNVFWRAEELSTAMTVRGYGRAVEKQTLQHMHLTTADRLGLALVTAWCITLYYLFRG